jgi:hypothetical protein
MVYNAQNYCVLGLCPLSGILETRKHNVLETGSVSVLRWRGETPTQWLRLALSKGPNRVGVSLHLRTETDPVSETSYFSSNYLESGRWTNFENPVILCVIHLRQNPIESTLPSCFLATIRGYTDRPTETQIQQILHYCMYSLPLKRVYLAVA